MFGKVDMDMLSADFLAMAFPENEISDN